LFDHRADDARQRDFINLPFGRTCSCVTHYLFPRSKIVRDFMIGCPERDRCPYRKPQPASEQPRIG
jgi:hypothetical protein